MRKASLKRWANNSLMGRRQCRNVGEVLRWDTQLHGDIALFHATLRQFFQICARRSVGTWLAAACELLMETISAS